MVTLTQTERISVIITTHYIEEARQANVVGLMRHGKILAEDSPDELMRKHGLHNLEDVFLKLCVTDSALKSASMAIGPGGRQHEISAPIDSRLVISSPSESSETTDSRRARHRVPQLDYSKRWDSLRVKDRHHEAFRASRRLEARLFTRPVQQSNSSMDGEDLDTKAPAMRVLSKPTKLALSDDNLRRKSSPNNGAYINELAVVEDFSSEESDTASSYGSDLHQRTHPQTNRTQHGNKPEPARDIYSEEYITLQAIKWASRRNSAANILSLKLRAIQSRGRNPSGHWPIRDADMNRGSTGGFQQWWKTLMAVTWKNYMRLRRNPPVLIFQFMLPAIQVILFCLCIGGEPFDVPVAVVNDEVDARSSKQFLDGLNSKVIRQVRYDNLSSAIQAVRDGSVWGVIHIPDKYTENLQSRMILGEDVTNETISNGTIKVYPDLTSK